MEVIEVRRKPFGALHHGLFTFGNQTIDCRLGRSGITTRKREGDGATPAGCFNLLYGFYRAERIGLVKPQLDLLTLEPNSGWCDASNHQNYNQYVDLPFSDSHEKMFRDDRLYDICIVLDYNIHPRKRGGGSAIFFHMTSIEAGPTEGCVAIDPKHMQMLLPHFTKNTTMQVHA